MEFKNREESTFWQLIMVAATRTGDLDPSPFADRALKCLRERMAGVEKQDQDIINKFDELLSEVKKGPKKPSGIMSLLPPSKKDPSDPTN